MACAVLGLARADRPTTTPPAATPRPFNTIDGVAAHECWHLLESSFMARRYTESIEFRRRLGQLLGVETLEKALYGREKTASPAEQVAFERLRTEVSGYATSNVREATAEMFQLYWFGGEQVSPLVAEFGRLVGAYFPLAAEADPS